jgi:hypothetical protein
MTILADPKPVRPDPIPAAAPVQESRPMSSTSVSKAGSSIPEGAPRAPANISRDDFSEIEVRWQARWAESGLFEIPGLPMS